jgi:hypothetical protein
MYLWTEIETRTSCFLEEPTDLPYLTLSTLYSGYSGDTILVSWYFSWFWWAATFLWLQDATSDSLQTVDERRASKRPTCTPVRAQVSKLLFARRAVQEAAPISPCQQLMKTFLFC